MFHPPPRIIILSYPFQPRSRRRDRFEAGKISYQSQVDGIFPRSISSHDRSSRHVGDNRGGSLLGRPTDFSERRSPRRRGLSNLEDVKKRQRPPNGQVFPMEKPQQGAGGREYAATDHHPVNEKFTISISRRIEASRPEPRTITRRDIKG